MRVWSLLLAAGYGERKSPSRLVVPAETTSGETGSVQAVVEVILIHHEVGLHGPAFIVAEVLTITFGVLLITAVESESVKDVAHATAILEQASMLLLAPIVIRSITFVHIDIKAFPGQCELLSLRLLLIFPHFGETVRVLRGHWHLDVGRFLNQNDAVVEVAPLKGYTERRVPIDVLCLQLGAPL